MDLNESPSENNELENLLRECDSIISTYHQLDQAAQKDSEADDLRTLRNELDNFCQSVSLHLSDANSSELPQNGQNNSNNPSNTTENEMNNEDDVIFVDILEPSIPIIDLSTPKIGRGKQRAQISRTDSVINIDDYECVLETKRFKKKEYENGNTQQSAQAQCPICLESVFKRVPTSTICGHIFCNKCIVLALKSNKKCPICKKHNPKLIKLYGLNI